MSYNFLRDAISIDNSPLCRYDTSDSYSSDFNINGDVDGWDVYYNTHYMVVGMVFFLEQLLIEILI